MLLTSETYKQQYDQLTAIVLKACPVESIWLLGTTTVKRRTGSIFQSEMPSCSHLAHCYFLVVINNETDCNQAQDKIENACDKLIPVTVIVLHQQRFEAWLREGHPFANAVHAKAEVLYGERPALSTIAAAKDEANIQKEKKAAYTEGLTKAEAFSAGADLYRIRNENKMAAFMLHQAAEQTLRTLLLFHTGLYLVTHNLDKLYRCCTMVCYQLPELMVGSHKENDKRLFTLLQKSYVEARYNQDYHINTTDILTLNKIVNGLHCLLKEQDIH